MESPDQTTSDNLCIYRAASFFEAFDLRAAVNFALKLFSFFRDGVKPEFGQPHQVSYRTLSELLIHIGSHLATPGRGGGGLR